MITNCLFTPSFFLNIESDLFLPFNIVEAGERTAIDHHSLFDIGFREILWLNSLIFWLDDDTNRQTILSGKLKVPLIMGRHCHHSSATILHENKIREIDWNGLAGKRVQTIGSYKNALLLPLLCSSLGLTQVLGALDKMPDGFLLCRALGKLQCAWVLDGK